MKYEYLQEKVDELIKYLQQETNRADNEWNMDELESIAIDLICKIPTQLVHKDYYGRTDIKRYLGKEYEENTSAINNFMNKVYEQDLISFDYDSVNNDIQETADKFVDMLKI